MKSMRDGAAAARLAHNQEVAGASPARATNRPSAAARGYGRQWEKARAGYLAKHPLCLKCGERGLTVAATVVDHIVPHRGDMKLFWASETNWQPLCKPCHDGPKQSQERGGVGFNAGCDADGLPRDPRHHWR